MKEAALKQALSIKNNGTTHKANTQKRNRNIKRKPNRTIQVMKAKGISIHFDSTCGAWAQQSPSPPPSPHSPVVPADGMPAKAKVAPKAKATPKATVKQEPTEEPSSKGRAVKGEGMDPKKVSTMLGLLKYRAGDKCKGDEQEKADAKQALACYQALSDPPSRVAFLAEFDKHGGGKGPGALKFAMTFKQTLTHTKTKEVSSLEDFFTRRDTSCLLIRRPQNKPIERTPQQQTQTKKSNIKISRKKKSNIEISKKKTCKPSGRRSSR